MEGLVAMGVASVSILMPVLLVLVIFFFNTKMQKDKYNTMIEISKNIEDPSEIKDLLEDLQEKKKPIDYRRSGVITLFVGVGLYLLGWTIAISAIQGAGFLVAAIGVGSIIAGYLYPNDSAEITKAVEDFEEK
ncbi:MAG TPA: hypothetical protein EYF74_02265 [Gammaproteobacteria bacterium]|jgi:hypothetical protein|nr:hypothetical protein [Gammaproteobacteria bacterium]